MTHPLLPTAEAAHQGLPLPRRTFAVVAIALGIAMAVLDGTIANVALPTIARQLQISSVESIWVINAYQLTIVMALLPLSSLGDGIGYRRVFTAGLLLFTFASLACSQADGLVSLVIARAFQGLGAAGMMSVNTALVRFTYPPHLLGQGIGINALVVAASAVIGPSIATIILEMGSWPWLFAVNLPIGAIALVAARCLPDPHGSGRRFDVPSALLNALTFGLLITAIDALGHGRAVGAVALQVGAAIAVGIVLVFRQLHRPAPLLPIDLLRNPVFALSITASFCAFAGQMLAFVSLPFHLQDALHRTQMETGLLMT
ncbi:MAG TPA: MFS transporter, partial [Telmatospirillum sp.]|nr:MFS transporter [Telmatospirillum sp.]